MKNKIGGKNNMNSFLSNLNKLFFNLSNLKTDILLLNEGINNIIKTPTNKVDYATLNTNIIDQFTLYINAESFIDDLINESKIEGIIKILIFYNKIHDFIKLFFTDVLITSITNLNIVNKITYIKDNLQTLDELIKELVRNLSDDKIIYIDILNNVISDEYIKKIQTELNEQSNNLNTCNKNDNQISKIIVYMIYIIQLSFLLKVKKEIDKTIPISELDKKSYQIIQSYLNLQISKNIDPNPKLKSENITIKVTIHLLKSLPSFLDVYKVLSNPILYDYMNKNDLYDNEVFKGLSEFGKDIIGMASINKINFNDQNKIFATFNNLNCIESFDTVLNSISKKKKQSKYFKYILPFPNEKDNSGAYTNTKISSKLCDNDYICKQDLKDTIIPIIIIYRLLTYKKVDIEKNMFDKLFNRISASKSKKSSSKFLDLYILGSAEEIKMFFNNNSDVNDEIDKKRFLDGVKCKLNIILNKENKNFEVYYDYDYDNIKKNGTSSIFYDSINATTLSTLNLTEKSFRENIYSKYNSIPNKETYLCLDKSTYDPAQKANIIKCIDNNGNMT